MIGNTLFRRQEEKVVRRCTQTQKETARAHLQIIPPEAQFAKGVAHEIGSQAHDLFDARACVGIRLRPNEHGGIERRQLIFLDNMYELAQTFLTPIIHELIVGRSWRTDLAA